MALRVLESSPRLYTTTASTIALIPTSTKRNIVVVPDENDGGSDPGVVLGPRYTTAGPLVAPSEPWTPPVWLWAGLFVTGLSTCCCGARVYVKRRRRRIREVLPDLEKAAPTILEQDTRASDSLFGTHD